jgi:hypothetical protein
MNFLKQFFGRGCQRGAQEAQARVHPQWRSRFPLSEVWASESWGCQQSQEFSVFHVVPRAKPPASPF